MKFGFCTFHHAKSRLPLIAAGLIGLQFSATESRAIAPFSDSTALFVTGVASAAYNTNLFLTHTNEKSDEIFDLMPGLSLQWGQNAQVNAGSLDAYVDFQLFSSYSNFNTALPNIVFTDKYDDSKLKLDADASYHELDLATVDVIGTLVKRDLYHADFIGEDLLTEKSSIASGITWDDTNYETRGYANLETFGIPTNYYYEVEPKLDVSAGFRFRTNTVGGTGIDSRDYYYNVGARGEFTPLLTGELDVGYNSQKMDIGPDHNGLGADGSLVYAYTDRTNLNLGLKDDFSYGADGRALREESVSLGVDTTIIDQWVADGSISYGRYSYFGDVPIAGVDIKQVDDFWAVQAGLSYIISTNLKARVAYTFQKDDSSISVYSFNDNIFTISLSASF